MRYFLITLLSLIFSVTLMSCNQMNQSPDKVAEKFWTAIQEGDFEKAKQFAVDGNIDSVKNNYQEGPHFSMTFDKVKIPENVSEIKVNTVFLPPEEKPEGHPLRFDTWLKYTQSGWKVDCETTSNEMFVAAFSAMTQMLTDAMKNIPEAIEQGANAFSEALKAKPQTQSSTNK